MSAATTTATGSKTVLLAVGGASLIGVGLPAGMYLSRPAATTPSMATTEISASAAVVAPVASAATEVSPQASAAAATSVAPVVVAEPAAKTEPKPVRKKVAPKETAQSAAHTEPATQPAPPPVICQTCGTVTGINPVQREVETSGVGAVAGGVIGGALGNQIGKGKGRTAMTILGAIGGGMAGNEIEKRKGAETVYEVTVRMDNGTTQVITVTNPPVSGARVEVHGDNLSPL